jgi:hypothetical protein
LIRICSAAAALVMTASAALPAFAAPCISPAAARAMQVRQLHIQLQVASLNCRGDDPSLPGKYASYVHRFGNPLNENARVLKSHFAKNGGNLDRYMTVLANDESQRAHQVEGYCESHVPLFDKLSSLKPSELEPFAATTMDKPDHPVCSTTTPVRNVSADTKPKSDKAKKTQPAG